MREKQTTNTTTKKKNVWLLGILLVIFLLKGVLLTLLLPFLQGPDEQIHYATITYQAEPRERSWDIHEKTPREDAHDIATYHFSEELINSAKILRFDEVKFESENTQAFSFPNSTFGPEENTLLHNNWKPFITTSPPRVSHTTSFFYFVGSTLERLFSEQDILTRMLILRVFSVLLGTLIVLFAYLTARKIGFDRQISLLLTTLVAFQPMFSFMTAVINIDSALYASFAIFLYSAICIIKDGLSWKNTTLATLGAILGIFAKGPGIVLVVLLYPLLAFGFWKRNTLPSRTFLLRFGLASVACIIVLLFVTPKQYLAGIVNATNASKFSSPIESIGKYLNKTIRIGELRDTETSYWGNFGWLDTPVPDWTINVIILIEAIGYGSAFFFLVRKKPFPDFLPSKTIIFACLIIIFALQGAIRFYDWRVFDATKQILIGQPGRYFLPTLFPTILVVITGIGLLLRKREYFHLALQTFVLLMILFQLSAIVNTIIPRYYL